ncbi:MAG TPA: ATP-binding cassette domain-containing protein [Bauldia sp.]|nr:ATP-binding cassette domain-containing protein [Bauldia sp.]
MSVVDAGASAGLIAARPGAWRRLLRSRLGTSAIAVVGIIAVIALAAPLLPLPDPDATNLAGRLQPLFSPSHVLGTDQLGRDLLARLIWATRTSLSVGVSAAAIAATIGSAIGLVAGYGGRLVDGVLLRVVDVLMAFPYLLLALGIVAALGPSLVHAMIAIVVVNIPFFARTVRGATLASAQSDFVAAARLSGRSHAGVVAFELLPNVMPTIVIALAASIGWMILETAGLSFLGLGAQPPEADLGGMLGEGRDLLPVAPHVVAVPGLAIFVLALVLNLAGDALRDVIDPRLAHGNLRRARAATSVERAAPAAPRQSDAVLEIADLATHFRLGASLIRAVDGVSLAVGAGEATGLVGLSGSGKSVTALSVARLVASPPGFIAAGSIFHRGEDILAASLRRLQQLRGGRIAYVFQDPLAALNPVMPVGAQIAETIRRHQGLGRTAAWARAASLMEGLRIADASRRAFAYPHELSGGERQRVCIAIALANDPDLLIADEPTTALDTVTQAAVLGLLTQQCRARGTALLLVSHDIALVAGLCRSISVMHAGKIVESGDAAEVLVRPQHPHTQRLLAPAVFAGRSREQDGAALLKLEDVSKTFVRGGHRVVAVDGVSLSARRGKTLAIVGESGSGKTTLARIITGLLVPSSGNVWLDGPPQRKRGRRVQMVFQGIAGSLNPRKTVGQIIATPLRALLGLKGAAVETRVAELMELVGLGPEYAQRFPHELSGGQAQRVGIARALAGDPELLVLDEPLSALDRPLQQQILTLLLEVQRRLGLTYVLVSHDLDVVKAVADDVAVVQRGRVTAAGPAAEVLSRSAGADT